MNIIKLGSMILLAAMALAVAGSVKAADNAPREEVILIEAVEFAPVDRAAIGVYGGVPTILYHFSRQFYGQLGLSITGAGGTTTTNVLLKGDWKLTGGKELSTHIGAAYLLTSNNAGSISSVGLNLGVTAAVVPQLTLTADIYPLTLNLGSGATTVSLMTGALGAHYYF